jgi:hypothetical protein
VAESGAELLKLPAATSHFLDGIRARLTRVLLGITQQSQCTAPCFQQKYARLLCCDVLCCAVLQAYGKRNVRPSQLDESRAVTRVVSLACGTRTEHIPGWPPGHRCRKVCCRPRRRSRTSRHRCRCAWQPPMPPPSSLLLHSLWPHQRTTSKLHALTYSLHTATTICAHSQLFHQAMPPSLTIRKLYLEHSRTQTRTTSHHTAISVLHPTLVSTVWVQIDAR